MGGSHWLFVGGGRGEEGKVVAGEWMIVVGVGVF